MPVTQLPQQPTATGAEQPERSRLSVWRYLRALGAAPSEADDLAQETMLAALRTRPAGIADPDAFLFGIARHQWLLLFASWPGVRVRLPNGTRYLEPVRNSGK